MQIHADMTETVQERARRERRRGERREPGGGHGPRRMEAACAQQH